MAKRKKFTTVTLNGVSLRCSASRKNALKRRLQTEYAKHENWTAKRWQSACESVAGEACWGVGKARGGDRRSTQYRSEHRYVKAKTSRNAPPSVSEQIKELEAEKFDLELRIAAIDDDLNRLKVPTAGGSTNGQNMLEDVAETVADGRKRIHFLIVMLQLFSSRCGHVYNSKGDMSHFLQSSGQADQVFKVCGLGGSCSFVRYLAVRYLQWIGFAVGPLLLIGAGAYQLSWQLCASTDRCDIAPPRGKQKKHTDK